jgi:hypothetical protein
MTLLTVVFIARPLVERSGARVTEEDRRLSTLRAERERIIAALQELEMDYAMGKVLQEDYQAHRKPLVSQGAQVLKAIDELQPVMGELDRDNQFEAELEAAVAQLRGSESMMAEGFCTACGKALLAGDRFCAHCGTAVAEEVGS